MGPRDAGIKADSRLRSGEIRGWRPWYYLQARPGRIGVLRQLSHNMVVDSSISIFTTKKIKWWAFSFSRTKRIPNREWMAVNLCQLQVRILWGKLRTEYISVVNTWIINFVSNTFVLYTEFIVSSDSVPVEKTFRLTADLHSVLKQGLTDEDWDLGGQTLSYSKTVRDLILVDFNSSTVFPVVTLELL